MEITLDKKQIQVIFLFKLKIDCKAMETTRNINNAFGPGTVTEHTLQPWFKKFCKGGKSLDGEEWLTIGSRRCSIERIIKADPLTTTQEAAKDLNINQSTVVWHLKQIGKVKKLKKQVPHELTTKKKNHFEVSSSLILHNNNDFSMKRILYHNQQ